MSRVAHHSTPKVTQEVKPEVTPEVTQEVKPEVTPRGHQEVTPRVIRQLSRGHQGEIPLNVEFGIIS
jgi:hypothetical protein